MVVGELVGVVVPVQEFAAKGREEHRDGEEDDEKRREP